MDSALFVGDLVQSLKEAKQIKDGEIKASRRVTVKAPDVKQVRESTGLSQNEFASTDCALNH